MTQTTDEVYRLPTLVREWGWGRISQQRQTLHQRASQFWIAQANKTENLRDLLNAHYHLLFAREYEEADKIVEIATKYLLRWGEIELLLQLLHESVQTLSGPRRLTALGNLATVYQEIGDFKQATALHQEVLQTLSESENSDTTQR